MKQVQEFPPQSSCKQNKLTDWQIVKQYIQISLTCGLYCKDNDHPHGWRKVGIGDQSRGCFPFMWEKTHAK